MSRRGVVINVDDDSNDIRPNQRPSGQQTAFRSWIIRKGQSGSFCKVIVIASILLLALFAAFFGLWVLTERNAFTATHTVVGERGPPGYCNLTQTNQTFIIAGETVLGDNLTIGGDFIMGDSFSIYEDPSTNCIVFNSTRPICMNNCLKTNCISSFTPGSNLTFNTPIVFPNGYPIYFLSSPTVQTSITIGGTTLFWNGSSLSFIGPVTLPTTAAVPIIVGSAGEITQSGSCILFNTSCVQFTGNVSFLGSGGLISPVVYTQMTMNGPIYFGNTTTMGIQQTNTTNLNIFSPSTLTLTSPSTTITGNLSVSGTITSQIKTSSSVLFECNPGPVYGTVGFDSNCSCLTISSPNGICLTANGSSGITVTATAGGLNIVDTPVSFSGSSYIASDVYINGVINVTGDINVNGAITATTLDFIDLNVSGSTYLSGPVYFNTTNITFSLINSTVIRADYITSRNQTTFQGQGATFDTGTTLLITSNLTINSIQSQVRCSNPVFVPNTPSTPNNASCVLECTDMSRCTTTMNNTYVLRRFEVGTSLNTSIVGEVYLGSITTNRQLSKLEINAVNVEINSTFPVLFNGDIDVQGSILQGVDPHPCCSGEQVDVNNKVLIVQMNVNTISLTTSEVSIIPFDTIQNPSSSLSIAWNSITYTFTSNQTRMYSITVYLSLDPSQFSSGTWRGVTLIRSFTLPSSTPVPIRICTHHTSFLSAPTRMEIVCTYVGFFDSGDTFQVTPYYDYSGSITLRGSNFPVLNPTTRLEVYAI